MKRFWSWPSGRSQTRLWIMYHLIFALLLVYFLTDQLVPRYVHIGSGFRSTFSALSLGAGPPPGRIPGPGLAGGGGVRVMTQGGRKLLFGGRGKDESFDITEFQLNPNHLHYGLGRERFPALIEPAFESVEAADERMQDEHRVLAIRISDEVKVYPLDLLRRHEVVNDVVGGRPVFAAYCILADLGVVYDRNTGPNTLTFAVSGYTYRDAEVWDGRQAFVLWDRDTESLWWPPLGKAVSGPLNGTPMKVLEHELWSQTTWEDITDNYPQSLVLKPGQTMTPPTDWPHLQITTAPTTQPADAHTPGIPPRWGANADLR